MAKICKKCICSCMGSFTYVGIRKCNNYTYRGVMKATYVIVGVTTTTSGVMKATYLIVGVTTTTRVVTVTPINTRGVTVTPSLILLP